MCICYLINHEFILEFRYDSNTKLTLQLADIVAEQGGPLSCLQTKITALISADLLVTLAMP